MIPSQILVKAWAELSQFVPIPTTESTSPLSFVQKVKCQALQKRLESLVADYEAAFNQMNYTLGAVDRTILQRQIDSISQDMDEVERELKSLGCA